MHISIVTYMCVCVCTVCVCVQECNCSEAALIMLQIDVCGTVTPYSCLFGIRQDQWAQAYVMVSNWQDFASLYQADTLAAVHDNDHIMHVPGNITLCSVSGWYSSREWAGTSNTSTAIVVSE